MTTPSVTLKALRACAFCTSIIILIFGSHIYDEIISPVARGKPNLTVVEDLGGIRFALVGAICFVALSLVLERIGNTGLRLESLRMYSIVGFVILLAALLWEVDSAARIASLSDSNGKIQMKAEHLFPPLSLWTHFVTITVLIFGYHVISSRLRNKDRG